MHRLPRILFNVLTLLSLALFLIVCALPIEMTLGQWTVKHSSGWITVQKGLQAPLIQWRGWMVMFDFLVLPLLWWAAYRRVRLASEKPNHDERDE